jgi:hypothetical protein
MWWCQPAIGSLAFFALRGPGCRAGGREIRLLYRPEKQKDMRDDPTSRIAGTWKLVSFQTAFDGADAVEPYGPDPKGRLVLTPEGHWIIILTGAGRRPAKTNDEKAALLDSMLAYSGRYIIEGDSITTRIDMSSNEVFSGLNRDQVRYFELEGDRLTIRTPEIVSAIRPGQKAVGTVVFERER